MEIHTTMGYVHAVTFTVAIIAALIVFLGEKGTHLHKLAGRVYALSMFATATSAGMIYFETQRFSVFYIFIPIIYWSVGSAIYYIRRYVRFGDPEDLFRHYREMIGSTMGLALAGVAQAMRFLPFDSFESYAVTVMIVYVPLIAGTQYIIRTSLRRKMAL